MESGTISNAPKFPSLPEHNARAGFFEKREFVVVVQNIPDADIRDFLEWFYWTGMRPKEIKSLTWEAFDRETRSLRLHARDAKTGYGRGLALEADLWSIIERRIAARRLDCNLIFHRDGRRLGEFRKLWKTACKKAGFVGKNVYDLRRTAVRNMVRAGVDETVAMKISGHRTRAVFDRYNITSDEDIRQAVLKTTEYVSALPSTPTVVPPRNQKGQPAAMWREGHGQNTDNLHNPCAIGSSGTLCESLEVLLRESFRVGGGGRI